MKQQISNIVATRAAMFHLGIALGLVLSIGAGVGYAADPPPETFPAYIDTDICARLMLGPITDKRIECSKSTQKEGAEPQVVRLRDNSVFEVNKQKKIKKLVGQLAEVTGVVKMKAGKIKLQNVQPVEASAIPNGAPGAEMLDVRMYRAPDARVFEQVRHELAMMPYISEYDFISFTMIGDQVILSGWTVRITNRNVAYNLVKNVEGVSGVTNNIEVLPMGSFDMQIRAGARARLQRMLGRYFWGNGSDIKIVVKNGNIILLGTVATEADRNVANIQANSVPGSFHVFNMLRVAPGKKKG